MKIVILLSILFISNLSYSNVLPGVRAAQVMKAIQNSLNIQDLECFDVKNGETFMASEIKWPIFKTQMTINDTQQPVVIIKGSESNVETVIEITTTSNFKLVEKIKIVSKKTEKTINNVGSIIQPDFKEVITKEVSEDVQCQ